MAHDAAKRRPFCWSANPAKLARVQTHGFVTQRLTEDIRAVPDPHEQAIGFGAVVGIVRRDQATGPGHILNHNGGISANVLAHMPPQGPCREIIASARSEPHHKANRFALLKLVSACRANSKRK